MSGNQPRNRGRIPSPGFLTGPAVASLFRAARHAAGPSGLPRPANFVVPQSAVCPVEVKI